MLQALKIQEEKLGADHPKTAITLYYIGRAYLDLEQAEKAKEYFLQALKIFEEKHGADHPDTAKTLHAITVVNSIIKQTEKPKQSVKVNDKQDINGQELEYD